MIRVPRLLDLLRLKRIAQADDCIVYHKLRRTGDGSHALHVFSRMQTRLCEIEAMEAQLIEAQP